MSTVLKCIKSNQTLQTVRVAEQNYINQAWNIFKCNTSEIVVFDQESAENSVYKMIAGFASSAEESNDVGARFVIYSTRTIIKMLISIHGHRIWLGICSGIYYYIRI